MTGTLPGHGTDLQIVPNGRRHRAIPKLGPARSSSARARRSRFAALRVVLFDESLAEFERFYDDLEGALAPRDAVDRLLVERIAVCAWRLRRISRIETGLCSQARVSGHNGTLKRTRNIELVFFRLTARDDALAKLTRYEQSLEQSLHLAMKGLNSHRLRNHRRVGNASSGLL